MTYIQVLYKHLVVFDAEINLNGCVKYYTNEQCIVGILFLPPPKTNSKLSESYVTSEK